MPITVDMNLGVWEYEYKMKEPRLECDGKYHYWYALGHTKEEFDKALVHLGLYEEYYGHSYKLEQDADKNIIVKPIEKVEFKKKAIIVDIDTPKPKKEEKKENKGYQQVSLFDL